MIKNEKKTNWLISLAVNAVILIAILMTTHMVYETNDDFAIASRIVDGYPETTFVNYYLCKIILLLQGMMPHMNAYVLFQIAASFIAFVCFYKIVLDGTGSRVIHCATALCIAVFSIDHYCTIQFTKTAALLSAAGLLVIVECITKKRHAGYLVLGTLLLYTGAAFRVDGLIACIGFTGVYGLYWLFINRKRLISDGYFTAGRIILYVVIVALVGGCYTFDNMSVKANQRTPELAAFWDYTMDRSEVIDFPVYDNYDDHRVEYEALGVNENDMYLIDHWYLDYDGAATGDNLRAIKEIYKSDNKDSVSIKEVVKDFISGTLKSVKKLGFTGCHVILLCVIAVWMITALRPKHWLYIIATGGLAVCLYLAVYYMQRPAYRAFYSADICSILWLLYALSNGYETDVTEHGTKRKGALLVMGVCTMLISALLMVPLHAKCEDSYNGIKGKIMPEALAQYIADNNDSFFTFATSEKKMNQSYLTPWLAPDTGAEGNVIGTGSWGTTSPFVMDKLAVYEIRNPIKDLIDNSKAYYIGNKRISKLTEYYNKWYGGDGKQIYLEKTAEISGYTIWAVKSIPAG